MMFAVRLECGGPWDWSRDLCEQDGFDEHALLIDSRVEDNWRQNGMLATSSIEPWTIPFDGRGS
jgi:hypothetical protein